MVWFLPLILIRTWGLDLVQPQGSKAFKEGDSNIVNRYGVDIDCDCCARIEGVTGFSTVVHVVHTVPLNLVATPLRMRRSTLSGPGNCC
jgi:hypothetical protein